MWFVVCLVLVPLVAGAEKDFINFGEFECPREEKALGRCLRDALNAYIPQLATGVPEYGVPPCEPLIVPALSIQQSSGPISVRSSYSNVTVKGPSKMKVKDVDVNTQLHRVVARLYIPDLQMTGNYRVTGKLLMLPIDGQGQFAAKYGDIDATVTIILGRQPRPTGVDALKCEDLAVSFHVGHATMKLGNLFGADDEFSHSLNQFLNDNWQKLIEELQTPMEVALRDFLKPLADHTFATLNADDILSN
uniref:SFRICE_007389 n=1 Tax=Spodoptera frugiperda TaxID=7108 RepID=A0A2H1VVY7_SPOFR